MFGDYGRLRLYTSTKECGTCQLAMPRGSDSPDDVEVQNVAHATEVVGETHESV